MPTQPDRHSKLGPIRMGPYDSRTWEEIAEAIFRVNPIELEERDERLARPLVVEVAFPGWQPRLWASAAAYGEQVPAAHSEGGVRFPALPTTIDEQVTGLLDAIDAGCAVTHVHPRDPSDGMATADTELYTMIYDKVLAQVDAVSCNHTWAVTEDGQVDYISETKALIDRGGGNRYCQAAVVLWPPLDAYPSRYEETVVEGMHYFREHDVKPIHKIRGSYHLRKMKRVLIDSGVLADDTPFVLVHDMGHPFGWTMDTSPWWPIDMIASIETSRTKLPNSVIGLGTGGRNWMPITMLGILLGVDYVRIGIEDSYYMYPHRDEVIQDNLDVVKKITAFCELIGRTLATPTEARAILGIRRTS